MVIRPPLLKVYLVQVLRIYTKSISNDESTDRPENIVVPVDIFDGYRGSGHDTDAIPTKSLPPAALQFNGAALGVSTRLTNAEPNQMVGREVFSHQYAKVPGLLRATFNVRTGAPVKHPTGAVLQS